MNPIPVLIVALFGIALLLSQGWRHVLSPAAGAQTKPLPAKGWLVFAVMMVLFAGGLVATLKPTTEQVMTALGPFMTMMSGIIAKWFMDATIESPADFDSTALARALVVAPLVALTTWKALEGATTLPALLLCFSNGFFWQTIFADLKRRKEKKQARATAKPTKLPGPNG